MNQNRNKADAVVGATAHPGPVALVDALNNTFGRHSGKRASHAKGFCAVGTFIPDLHAAQFADSELFKAKSAEALVRFSVGGGNPAISDKSRTVRGMALRIASRGESWDLLMVSEPVFFAATPESFVSFLEARIPDPITKKPNPDKIAAHNDRFPDGKLQPSLLASHPAPRSYAQTPYFANHAFLFKGALNQVQAARIILEPVLGATNLTEEEEASFPENFLEKELVAQLEKGTVKFEMLAQLPSPTDSLVDPSQQWVGLQNVKLGTLHINYVSTEDECDRLMFSPTNLPAAIAPSADPVLAARAAAYDVSFARRKAKGPQG